MTLSARIFLGLLLGSAAGVFFGEPMGRLAIVGTAFVRLLQMTVLPYVVVSLVLGLGSLTIREARILATQGGLVLVALWLIAFAFVAAAPLVLPSSDAELFAGFYARTARDVALVGHSFGGATAAACVLRDSTSRKPRFSHCFLSDPWIGGFASPLQHHGAAALVPRLPSSPGAG